MMLLANREDGADGVIRFLRHYSSHSIERRGMILRLLKNDIHRIEKFSPEIDGEDVVTNAAQVIRSYFAGLGIELTKEQSEAVDEMVDEYEEDEE